MPPKIGEFLIKSGVRLTLIYGGTEFGCPTIPFANPNEPEGWEYIGFDDAASIRWESQGDGAYELQFMVSRWFACEAVVSNNIESRPANVTIWQSKT